MKTILALLLVISIVNIVIFLLNKLGNLIAPYVLKLLFKHDVNAMLNDPEIQEKGRVRNKYMHWFWSLWVVLYYSIGTLTGLNFFLALFAALVLYFVGHAEADALAGVLRRYREKEFLEAESLTEKFLTEVANRMQAMQVEKKDDERN